MAARVHYPNLEYQIWDYRLQQSKGGFKSLLTTSLALAQSMANMVACEQEQIGPAWVRIPFGIIFTTFSLSSTLNMV